MRKFCQPNLPQESVCVAIAATPLPVETRIPTVPLEVLPTGMQSHADLQICHLDENVVLCAPEVYAYYQEKLVPYGFEVLCGKTPVGGTYPFDAAYNILRVGQTAFHNLKLTDAVAVAYFEKHHIRFVHVRQGYAKCAAVPVRENALITADAGIARAARNEKMDVLEIEPGFIKLPGFSYGFIGGAMAKLSENHIYITGKLHAHPSKTKIFDFLKKYSIKIEEGSEPIPVDIGSVVPLLTNSSEKPAHHTERRSP